MNEEMKEEKLVNEIEIELSEGDLRPEVYKEPNALKVLVDRIVGKFDGLALDGGTAKGRAECISLAAKVRKTKTVIEERGKAVAGEIKAQAKVIDEQRKLARERLDELAVKLRGPATEWEAGEAKRIAEHRDIIQRLLEVPAKVSGRDLAQWTDEVFEQVAGKVAEWHGRDFEEYKGEADVAWQVAVHAIEKRRGEYGKWVSDQRELEKLRAEKVLADQKAAEEAWKAREEEIARKAAERATRETEARLRAEIGAGGVSAPVPVVVTATGRKKPELAGDVERARTVNRWAVDDIMMAAGVSDSTAMAVVRAIAKGQVRNVTINYIGK